MTLNPSSIQQICQDLRLISEALNIPIFLYEKKQLVFSFPPSAKFFAPPEEYAAGAQEKAAASCFLTTGFSGIYGILPVRLIPDSFLLIGPITRSLYSESEFSRLFSFFRIEKEKEEKFRDFIYQIPVETVSAFSNQLSMIHHFLNQDQPVLSFSFEHNSIAAFKAIHEGIENACIGREEEPMLNPTLKEDYLVRMIETGSVEECGELKESFFAFSTGDPKAKVMRSVKNDVIALIVVASRAAIRGGLDAQTSLELSASFMRSTEDSVTLDEISSVIFSMLRTYTRLTAESLQNPLPINDSAEIAAYIREHVDLPLSGTYLASVFGYDPAYLSRKFRKQTGIHLSAYVRQAKLEDAKRLLRYTSRSLSEISSYYCFSSQSHFQRAFKEYTKMTPLQYRKARQNSDILENSRETAAAQP